MFYSQELELRASRSQITSFFIDPIRFAGMFGHLLIVKIFDKEKNNYLPMGNLRNPENKFRVVYVLGDPDSRMTLMKGYMEGPIISLGGIEYKGNTDDNKLSWKIGLYILDSSKGISKVKIIGDYKQDYGVFDRIFSGGDFNLAEHLVKEHVVPFLSLYFKPSLEEGYSINEIINLKGNVDEILSKMRELINTVKYGGAIIIGENLEILMSITNGDISQVQINGSPSQAGDVMVSLLKAKGEIRLIAYEMGFEDIVLKNLKKKAEEIKWAFH